MKRRVIQAFSLCLLAGVLTVGTGTIGVLAKEEVPVGTTGEVGESLVGKLIFAQCDDFVNIRNSADTEGEVIAKIFNNGSATVVSEEKDGWFGIQSGNASGYVKADYFATGEAAEAIARDVAYVAAVVQANEVAIRSQASLDSVVLDCANIGDELEVVEDDGDWLKVARGNDLYGYIHADYVEVETYYPAAKTLEELEEEEAEEEFEEDNEEEPEEADTVYEETSYYEEETCEEAVYEETSYEETSYEETSYEETYYEEASYEEISYDETYFEETSYEETSYEETSYSETLYDEDTYTETSAPDVTEETEAYVETTYVETEAPATEAVAEAVSDSYETGVSYDSTYNGDDYYYDANEDAYYYGSTRIDSYSYTQDVEETEAVEETIVEAEVEAIVEDEAEETAAEESYSEEVKAAEETVETEGTVETEKAEETTETESSSTSSSISGQDIADYATQFIGNDYVYGGTSLTNGADCSGFVQSVYADSGISLARVAADQAEGGTTVDTDDLEAGDLLFYSSDGEEIDHVAIYIGDDTIVHAANSKRGIVTDDAFYDEPVTAVRYY